jgi:hypothetical protein
MELRICCYGDMHPFMDSNELGQPNTNDITSYTVIELLLLCRVIH